MSASGFLLLLISAMIGCAAPQEENGKKCYRPYIKHGSMYYNYDFPISLGRYVYYHCKINYLSHQREYWGQIYCTDLGWDPKPNCTRQCSSIEADVENADLINKQFDYLEGEKVQFRCKYNSYTPDGKTDGERTCLPNGEFTPAKCSRLCKAPELPDGKFKPIKNLFDIGEYLHYECNEGFMTKIRQLNSSALCQDRGWSEVPRCRPITCIHFGVSYKDGDVIKYKCPRGQRPEIELGQCYYFGLHPPPKCIETSCTHPPHVNDSRIYGLRKYKYVSGEKVTYVCNSGFAFERSSTGEAICEDTQWKNVPVCRSQCKISTEDLNLHNIQLLPSDNNPDIPHRHGTELNVTCKSGFRRPNREALVIECNDGEFRYPKCFAGKTCRIDQDEMDKNNLELDEMHNNEIFYEENERVHFKCKTGYNRKTKLIGKCSEETMIYPSCTA